MARYIDADALIHHLYETEYASMYYIEVVKRIIDAQPTLSPDEVRGVGEITDDDACPVCGCCIPTDDAHDAIFKNEVKFCYYCGTRLRMKGADA